MFISAFQQLNIDPSAVRQSPTPLSGFKGHKTWPVGEVTLTVTLGGKSLQTNFILVDRPSAYNSITGREWLHRMDVEASTRYEVLKFISYEGDKVIFIRGDQVTAKKLHAMEISYAGSAATSGEAPKEA